MSARVWLIAALLAPGTALAYPWMIKHQYTGCATCHGDPSGGGVLTEYGRAQDVLLATMPYGAPKTEEPGRAADFAWAAKLPEWLLATVSYRGALFGLSSTSPSTPSSPSRTVSDFRYLNMLLDARAQARVGAFVASLSLGLGAYPETLPAAVAPQGTDLYLLSREHWVGVKLADDTVLIRAGRMNLPYGLRNVEHTSWVRSLTATDINFSQQHGVSAFFGNDRVRTEVMAVLGNYRIAPDAVRERGYSGYVEVAVAANAGVGVSSLVTEARQGPLAPGPALRQAHGVFFRWGPRPLFALTGEADVTVTKQLGRGPYQLGGAGLVQLDIEPLRGFHVIPAVELIQTFGQVAPSVGGWLTLDWFFLPHTDLRVDAMYQAIPDSAGSIRNLIVLAQLHTYL